MRSRPNPYRVLAFALDVGDRRLAALLTDRLSRAHAPLGTAPSRAATLVVERLVALLGPRPAQG